MERQYTDLTSLEAYPSGGAYPTKDEEGNPLETEYGKCKTHWKQKAGIGENRTELVGSANVKYNLASSCLLISLSLTPFSSQGSVCTRTTRQ